MKRTFTTIVCALLLVAMLAGCGSTGSTNPFDAKAKTFSDDGMQITLTTAFSEEDLEGYTVGYAADTAIVLALHETKAEFAEAGAEDVTFEQYVEFVRQANSDKELVDGEPIDGNPTLLYDFLNEELPEFVENYFPVSDKSEERYIAGLSMGGYGALLHGLTNPGKYRAIGAFSPGIPAENADPDLNRIARFNLFDVTCKALASGEKLPDLFMCIGDGDFLYERVTSYRKAFLDGWTASRCRYDDIPGYEHEFAFWDKELVEFLEWIRREDAYSKMGKNKV